MQQFQPEWVGRLRKGQLVPLYLISSFLYYQCDRSLMVDSAYDLLCVRLLNEWNTVAHRHKSLVSRRSLQATTGFNLQRKDYPTLVQVAAHDLYDRAEASTLYEAYFGAPPAPARKPVPRFVRRTVPQVSAPPPAPVKPAISRVFRPRPKP